MDTSPIDVLHERFRPTRPKRSPSGREISPVTTDPQDASRPSTETGSSSGRLFFLVSISLRGLLLSGGLVSLSGCFLFGHPPEPVETFSLATPKEAFRSFQEAVAANNDPLIWQAISDRRRQEDGITWGDYMTYKDLVKIRYGSALDLLEEAVLESVQIRGDAARLHLIAEDLEVYVDLVRESYYEIVVENPDGNVYRYYDFIRRASPYVERGAGEVVVTLPLKADQPLPPGPIAEVRLLDEWKFYSVTEPSRISPE